MKIVRKSIVILMTVGLAISVLGGTSPLGDREPPIATELSN